MSQTVKVLAHTFTVSDYDIRDAMNREVEEWKESEKGCWVLKNCLCKPMIHQVYNQDYIGYDICVTFFLTAELSEDDALYYALKWG